MRYFCRDLKGTLPRGIHDHTICSLETGKLRKNNEANYLRSCQEMSGR